MTRPASNKRRRRYCGERRQAAFSLIELLVVVAIIGLLLTLLLPSLMRARLLAMRTKCAVNLKALGSAAMIYRADYDDFVPVCWGNLDPALPNPWKSWRTMLLAYAPHYTVFNCPAAEDTAQLGEVFHSAEEITGFEQEGTVNAGSYGVMEQFSLPSFETQDFGGIVRRGYPVWTNAFPTTPGLAWRDPFNSVYVADSCICKGPIAYPSRTHRGFGSSVIRPPSDPGYFGVAVSRRFADRHAGTNCLFLGGHVLSYETRRLDAMVAGEPGCVWDVE
jgi:prepilin-type N-terminal cleavage/methylation domain-containing protein/prepilin-type processing-associated H-X9-DG protein